MAGLLGAYDSPLGRHPDRNLVPGVEISSGSLGHGLPLAVGTALGLRAQGIRSRPVHVVRRGAGATVVAVVRCWTPWWRSSPGGT